MWYKLYFMLWSVFFSTALANLCLIAKTWCCFEVPLAGQICMMGASGSDYYHDKKLDYTTVLKWKILSSQQIVDNARHYVRLVDFSKRWSEAWSRLCCFYHHWPRQMRLVGNNRTDSGVSACWPLWRTPEEAAHRGVSMPADMRSLTTGQRPPKGAKACNQSCAER